MSCDGTPSGIANIDLRGTPFTVIDPFETGGFAASGSANKSDSGQAVSIAGGGYCGWEVSWSTGGNFNPFNVCGTFQLDLAFLGYSSSGFLPPVAMPPAVNTGRGGQTYPIKWQLTQNGNYVNDVSVVQSITCKSVSCTDLTGTATDISADTSGDSGLRYDFTDNQFVYNWSTPGAGCYILSVAFNTGQVFSANFSLR